MNFIDITLKIISTLTGHVINAFREKEANLKRYYDHYYIEIEVEIGRHLTVIDCLDQEITSYSSYNDEDMVAVLEDIQAHNDGMYEAARYNSGNKSLKEMAIDIDALVIKFDGVVHESLIHSLRQYSMDLYDANDIGEFHFLKTPCANILALIRDIRSRIPLIHASSDIQ